MAGGSGVLGYQKLNIKAVIRKQNVDFSGSKGGSIASPPPHGKEGTVQPHLLDPGEPGCWLGPPELALLPLLEWMGLRLELVLFALWPAGRLLGVEGRTHWAGVSLSVTIRSACARGSEWPSEGVLCRGLPHVLS